MPKEKRTDWVKRSGRRSLTEEEAAKVESKRVGSQLDTAKRTARRKARAAALLKKPKPKPKPLPWYKKYNPFRTLAEGPLNQKKKED